MTQDEIVNMAKEAGFFEFNVEGWSKEFERFATLVAAHDREALAEQDKQEPVAWVSAKESFCGFPKLVFSETKKAGYKPLYAAPVSAPKQKPVAFYIYKPTPARFDQFKGGVLDGSLPWVYDQDPSSGFVASMLVAPCDAPIDAKAIRAEALEEAAQECDKWASVKPFSDFSSGSAAGAQNCAAAIRARGEK